MSLLRWLNKSWSDRTKLLNIRRKISKCKRIWRCLIVSSDPPYSVTYTPSRRAKTSKTNRKLSLILKHTQIFYKWTGFRKILLYLSSSSQILWRIPWNHHLSPKLLRITTTRRKSTLVPILRFSQKRPLHHHRIKLLWPKRSLCKSPLWVLRISLGKQQA